MTLRSDIEEWLEGYADSQDRGWDMADDHNDAALILRRCLAALPEWVSVDERLPEKPGRYTVLRPELGDGDPLDAVRYLGDGKWLGCRYFPATYWLDGLPPPPQAQEEAK